MVSFCKFWHFVSPRGNGFFLPLIKLLTGRLPYIRVNYKTKKCGFDHVSGDLLKALITLDEITHFYRASEQNLTMSVKSHFEFYSFM
jgi:hypothetical protein